MKKILPLVFILISTIQIQTKAQSEPDWILRLFNYSVDVTSVSDYIISLSIDAAWLASEINNQTTLTGTLSQNAQGNWGYSSSPSDKLVVVFNDGSSIEFKFAKIEGYVDGDADDFKDSHSMDFTAYSPNYVNVRIVSNIGTVNENIEWQNVITGNMIINGNDHTVNITHQGWKYSEIGNGFAFFKKDDLVTGTSSSAVSSYQINDRVYVEIGHNSNDGLYNKSTQFWKNSSLTTGSTKYAFQGVNVFYIGYTEIYDSANVGYYNKVHESYNWSAEGSLLKNDQQYASVMFSSAPIDGTTGPYLIAKQNGGGEIILHYLLNPPPTDVSDNSVEVVSEYKLEQNYPNPFNPSTTIQYSIPTDKEHLLSSTNVTLKIYDILGREIATLVDEQQKPGIYSVKWDAVNNPSGIYFYRLVVGNFSQTKKMILQK